MYGEIRRHYFLPVPSLFVIKNWLKQLNFRPGLQTSSLDALTTTSGNTNSKSMEHNFVILVLDELDIIRNNYISSNETFLRTYKKKNREKVVETCENIPSPDLIASSDDDRQVLVRNVIVRGLCSSHNWELPLYLEFDRKAMRKNLLLQIISETEERSGVQIWAIIVNMVQDIELINELGLNEEVTSFPNPFDNSRNVYCFADTFTLIEQQRKQILEHGVQIPGDYKDNGCPKVWLMKSDFEDLVKRVDGDKRFGELTSLDLSINKCGKEGLKSQNVSSAIQLLSRKTADAIEALFPDKKAQAEWIRVWSDFFELMTENLSFGSSISEGLGEPYLSEKIGILDKISDLVLNTRGCLNTKLINVKESNYLKTLQPFQKATIWTVKSVKSLYNNLQAYLTAYGDNTDGKATMLRTNRLSFHDPDESYHRAAQQHANHIDGEVIDSSLIEKNEKVSITEKTSQILTTRRPNLYKTLLSSLSLKETIGVDKEKGIRIRANRKKKLKRLPSPPPTNPSTILEYKLSPDGKVHIPLGHPQVDSVQDKSKLEIISKEPQIKIVYPDDPENSLLMLQQQSVSEQLSVLQEGEEQNSREACYQETILHDEYTAGSATIVITEAIEGNGCVTECDKSNHNPIPMPSCTSSDTLTQNKLGEGIRDLKNHLSRYNNGGNSGMVHLNQVDIVDADGNINERYYIS